MTDKAMINDVKHKLSCYQFYLRQIFGWNLEIEAREAQINGVASGSPKKLPEGNSPDDDWRSPLFEEITELERRINATTLIIEQVDSFVDKLENDDKIIIGKLYLWTKNYSHRVVGEQHGYSREGIRDRTSKIIRDYWEY